MHPAIKEELDMLRERFPGKSEATLDDWAAYFGIDRRNAPRHFNRETQDGKTIGHKKIGKRGSPVIPMLDFAYWLAQRKVVDGMPLVLNGGGNIKTEMKRRRGFCAPQHEYRQLG
jgi:DNA polymerase III epsilon subunit-like protein